MGQQLIKSSKSDKKFKLVTLTENRIINKNLLRENFGRDKFKLFLPWYYLIKFAYRLYL